MSIICPSNTVESKRRIQMCHSFFNALGKKSLEYDSFKIVAVCLIEDRKPIDKEREQIMNTG